MESKTCTAFERLSDILDTLRKECPWDREQTMKSLRYLTIEEVHELSEAIVALESSQSGVRSSEDERKISELKKELGDLAMHVMFYCKIAEEEGLFTTADVYNTICDKLVARHPFIYHKDDYHGESWEQLKMKEKDHRNVLDGVPDSLPSLVKAVRMQEKVAGMREENGEQGTAMADALNTSERIMQNAELTEEEFGEYLFALVDWSRRHGINADDALCGANHRFRQRYQSPTE